MSPKFRSHILTGTTIEFFLCYESRLLVALPQPPQWPEEICDARRTSVLVRAGYPGLVIWTSRRLGDAFLRLDGRVGYKWRDGSDGYGALGRKKSEQIRDWLVSADRIAKDIALSAPRVVTDDHRRWHTFGNRLYPWFYRYNVAQTAESVAGWKQHAETLRQISQADAPSFLSGS